MIEPPFVSAGRIIKMAQDKKKQIIIGVICAILFLNIMWTIMQNKFTPKLDSVKADVAGVAQRIEKLENGGIPDVADLIRNFNRCAAVRTIHNLHYPFLFC